MKATGVIRRIDNLGRIVIPKEIRKNLRIKTGENLEIFVNESDNIILRKYNHLDKLEDISNELTNSLYKITKKNIYITTNHKIISSNIKENINKDISNELIELIEKRKETEKENLQITEKNYLKEKALINPILVGGDIVGSIIIENKKLNEIDKTLIKLSEKFLSLHIEN